jgi:shikimate dehydrogenase
MIDAQTQLYGVIGNPVRHSLSPVIHNGAFQRMGLNAAYLAFEVNNLEEAVRGIRGLGIRGVSVTIPFKTQIIPFLDQLDEVAIKIQAVNTICNEGGKLTGYNTDWSGALGALEEKVDLTGKRVFLLGAGGAARAIAFGLKERGCHVFIASRSPKKAAALAEELGMVHRPFPFAGRLDADVLVNATSAGMSPSDEESPVPKEVLDKRITVMDIVYKPLKTKLLREAEERGCRTIDGLEMLARQGAAQVEIWTGKKPEIKEIKEDLRRALNQHSAISYQLSALSNQERKTTIDGSML